MVDQRAPTRPEIRRLGRGDEALLERWCRQDARFELEGRASRSHDPPHPARARRFLTSATTHILAAFSDGEAVGFLLAYELGRRHGAQRMLFVYEMGVALEHRRQGVGRALFGALAELGRQRGIERAFVLTDEDNPDAMAFYRSLGPRGEHHDIQFDFSLKP
jgi:ribosomal protein S18 acetylase RimI-like enzyme